MAAPPSRADYAKKKAYAQEKSRETALLGREIGPLPPVANPERRAACERDFRLFCETYLAATFCIPWSPDHLRVIGRVQTCVLEGGQFALAMPRGFGKTSLCEAAGTWAFAYGHRRFVVLIGASETHAEEILESLASELEHNEELAADFPEICYPIRALEGIANRANGQLLDGERTEITWTKSELVLPTVAGSKSSGSVVKVAGITGRIRGMSYKRADGAKVRPDLVLCDDPQTDEALDVDTPIPTPRGFVRMGELAVGDTVFDELGRRCSITATSPTMVGHPCFRVTFDDGTSVIADAGHKWETSTALHRTNLRRRVAKPVRGAALRPQCRPQPTTAIVTTGQLAGTITGEGGRSNHSIPMASHIECERRELPVPPYTFGVWLGDGDRSGGRVTAADPQVLEEIARETSMRIGRGHRCEYQGRLSRASTQTVHGLRRLLRRAGMLHQKHIPEHYLFAHADDRLSLLQGLMDTDGSVSLGTQGVKGTRCVFSNTNRNLVDGVLHLCRSFGIKARANLVGKHPRFPKALPLWKVEFVTSVPVFRMQRKRERIPVATKPSARRRFIVAVEPVESRPVRCISVDSPSRLYLCGEGMVATHNSARSLTQCETRERIVARAVLGLAGPKKKIAALMPCTVIRAGDMADNLLDRKKHPEWNGERTKMLYAIPTSKRWERYAELRGESLREHGDIRTATALYVEHREEMDAGGAVAWPELFQPDEVSAIQHAMNLMIADPASFASERQNDPLPEKGLADLEALTADYIAQKLNGYAEFLVPVSASRLTAFIDVQKDVLYFVVAAWSDDFTGFVVRYGTWPDQQREYFHLGDVQHTLARAFPKTGLEGWIYAGLDALCGELLSREWTKDDGTSIRIERTLIDAGWGDSTDVVYQFCRQSAHAAIVMPSRGIGITAKKEPMSAWAIKPGDRVGPEWRVPAGKSRREVRHLDYNTNHWKSFVHARLAQAMGEPGCLSLYGRNPYRHRMIAEHFTAEARVRMQGPKRSADEWALKPGVRENHWFDGIVGAAVAASMTGAALPNMAPEPAKERKRVKFSELQRQRREAFG